MENSKRKGERNERGETKIDDIEFILGHGTAQSGTALTVFQRWVTQITAPGPNKVEL